MNDTDLVTRTKLFVKRSLCPYCRVLYSSRKHLHKIRKTYSCYITSETVKVKITEKSFPFLITHLHDLRKYFPDVRLSSSSHTSWLFWKTFKFLARGIFDKCILILILVPFHTFPHNFSTFSFLLIVYCDR